MPMALFSPANRERLKIATVFPLASHESHGDDEDIFLVDHCRVTCRYWTQGGDFVSKQILGCGTAVRSGRLRCKDVAAVEKQIYETQSVIGVVGPDDAARSLVSSLAAHYSGVLVHGDEATIV